MAARMTFGGGFAWKIWFWKFKKGKLQNANSIEGQ
jgi:hypothetical protein